MKERSLRYAANVIFLLMLGVSESFAFATGNFRCKATPFPTRPGIYLPQERSKTHRMSLATSDANVPGVDERLREENPIEYISQEVNTKMDGNAIFNTGIIVVAALAVLNQVATVDAGITRGWTVEEMALRIPFDNWNSYSAVLSAAPIQTKAVTSATVYAIGDFIAQRTEGVSMGELDRPRLIRSLLAGLIGHGPMSHVWYGVSETLFQDILHLPSDMWGTAAKVFIDQTCWGPIWNNTYILMLGVMKLNSLETIWGEVRRTTVPLILSGLKLWPLAHCVTYGLIPVENRLLWVDLVEILWVTILATAAAAPPPTDDGTEKTALEKDDAL